jgi:hypothetical protein
MVDLTEFDQSNREYYCYRTAANPNLTVANRHVANCYCCESFLILRYNAKPS